MLWFSPAASRTPTPDKPSSEPILPSPHTDIHRTAHYPRALSDIDPPNIRPHLRGEHGCVPGASSLRRSSHTSRSRIAANPSSNFNTPRSVLRLFQVWRHLNSTASLLSLVISSVTILTHLVYGRLAGHRFEPHPYRTDPVGFSTACRSTQVSKAFAICT